MPGINFNAPEEFLEKLKAYQEEHEIDNQSAFIREALDAAMEPKTLMDTVPVPTPRPVPPLAPTPTAAAEIILGLLPENQRVLIQDVAQEHGRAPLDFILSYCKLADERGETATLIAEQMRDDEEPTPYVGTLQSPSAGEYQACAWEGCRKPLAVTRRGQKYCPDPDDGTPGCGRKATLADMHRKRPKSRNAQGHHARELEEQFEAQRQAAPQLR